MMMQLLKFEWLKAKKKKKNMIIFALVIALVFIIMIANIWMENTLNSSKIDSLKYQLTSLNEAISSQPNDENNPKLEKIKVHDQKEKKLLEEQIEALQQDDWRQYLRSKNKHDALTIEGLSKGILIGGEPLHLIEKRLKLNTELLKRDIEPADSNYGTKGYYNLKNTLHIFIGLFGIIIFLLLTGDILSNELETASGKFLFAQPVSRIQIINAKFITSFVGIVLTLVIVCIVSFSMGSLFRGVGSYQYPIQIQFNGKETFMDLWLFSLVCAVLFLFVMTFVLTIQFLFSVLTRSNTLSIGLVVILFSISYVGITRYHFLRSIAHIMPFSYFDPFSIVDGSVAEQLDNPNISVYTGLVVLTIFSLLLYLVTLRIVQKKDI